MLAADVATALASILRGTRSADSLENQTLEFTTQKPSDKETCQDLAEAAVCFANSTGGRIVLGVADTKLGQEAFLGTSIRVDVVRARIHALTEPSLLVTVEELQHAGARLLGRHPAAAHPFAQHTGPVSSPARNRCGQRCAERPPADPRQRNADARGRDPRVRERH